MIAGWTTTLLGSLTFAMSAAAEEPMHHLSCPNQMVVGASGDSVADFLAETPRNQARSVRAVMDAVALNSPPVIPAACLPFFIDCFAAIDERLGAAVAQGYLTGRTALSEREATKGIFEALEQYCLGIWTPGSP